MSEELCIPRALKTCDETEVQSATDDSFECPSFSVCLPFGGSLSFDGGCINYEAGTPPADGTYGKVIVEGGCIVGVEQDVVPQYAATPCAPVPNPCDCGDGSGATISTQAGNLITQDATGALLAKLYVQGNNGISVSGYGTAERPLIISGSGSGSGAGALVGDSIIKIRSLANNTTAISHAESPTQGITVNGMTFDSYGHLESYTAPSGLGNGLTAVVGGDGIKAETNPNSQIATISLEELKPDPSGTSLLGGYNVTVDNHGRVTDISRAITIPARTYTLGEYDVTTNAYGSITNIVKNSSGGGDDTTPAIGLAANFISFYHSWDDYNADEEVEIPVTLLNRCRIRVDVSVSDACSTPHRPTIYVDNTRLSYGVPFSTVGGYYAFANSAFTATELSAGTHTIRFAYDRFSQGICATGDEGGNASGEFVTATIYGTTLTEGDTVE